LAPVKFIDHSSFTGTRRPRWASLPQLRQHSGWGTKWPVERLVVGLFGLHQVGGRRRHLLSGLRYESFPGRWVAPPMPTMTC